MSYSVSENELKDQMMKISLIIDIPEPAHVTSFDIDLIILTFNW